MIKNIEKSLSNCSFYCFVATDLVVTCDSQLLDQFSDLSFNYTDHHRYQLDDLSRSVHLLDRLMMMMGICKIKVSTQDT